MNWEEARQAMIDGRLIKLNRIGRPSDPYIGRLIRELNDGTFLFAGKSGSESITGKVKPEEVFLIQKEE